MSNNSKNAAKAASKNNQINVNEVNKSETAKVSAKADKAPLSAEEIAAKQQKQAINTRNKVTRSILDDTQHSVLGVTNWLRAALAASKKIDPSFAKQMDERWAQLSLEIKLNATGQVILEEYEKDGKVMNKVHMVKFVPADKIGKKSHLATKPTGFVYDWSEGVQTINKVDDLTITRKVTERVKLSKVFEGVEYVRYNDVVVEKQLKPYEVLDLSKQEFKNGFEKAMEKVFPYGFAVTK